MNIPFSPEQFFDVFARYNQSVWPMQIVLNLMALGVVALASRKGPLQGRLISAVLSFFWPWMAVAYHFVFFTTINPAAWLFGVLFLAGATGFAWIGVIRGRLRFLPSGGNRGRAGGVLLVFALIVYPR